MLATSFKKKKKKKKNHLQYEDDLCFPTGRAEQLVSIST